MQIGILPVLNPQSGGIYQNSTTLLTLLYEQERGDEYIVFVEDAARLGYLGDEREGWRVAPVERFTVRRAFKKYVRRLLGDERLHELWDAPIKRRRRVNEFDDDGEEESLDPDVVNYRPEQGRWFAHHGAEMMLYPAPTIQSFESGIPYVMVVPDVQHKLQPEFPEVSADGRLDAREYLFRNGTRYATTILADSETGKEDILNHYGAFGITAERIQVLPYLPGPFLSAEASADQILEARARFNLPERYLFCPAHFWPHKNHAKLIEAMYVLQEEYGLRASLILSGSSSGRIRTDCYEQFMGLILQYGFEDRVRHVGFVADEDMAALYAGAVAMVLPTFFGTAHLSVVEAWAQGCPVVISNLRGIREQVGDTAMLVDPKSAQSLADGIRRVWVDSSLRTNLIDRGKVRFSSYTPRDYVQRLSAILKESASRIDPMENP